MTSPPVLARDGEIAMTARAYSYERFSSTEQGKGHGLRRQIERRDAYLARRGLTLDTTLRLSDPGVSAYRGRNATDGALGVFLELVRAGRIPPGSYLIVEN